MPSSPNYKRDYKQEYATETKQRRKQRAERNKARSIMEKAGAVKKGDGKHVDHIKPLSQGGTTKKSNLRVRSQHANDSYARTSSGAIKKKTK